MKVAIIGGGVMGEAILAAALERGVFTPAGVVVCEVLEHRRNQLRAEYGVGVAASSAEAMAAADIVLLSVKPQDVHSIRGQVRDEALIISIMAGIPVRAIIEEFHHERVVRVMPNTPVAAKAGMSTWTATAAVSDEQRALTRSLLGAIGREMYFDDEKKLWAQSLKFVKTPPAQLKLLGRYVVDLLKESAG